MRKSPLLLAVVLLALLGLIVLLVLGGQGKPAKKKEVAVLLYPDLDTSRVDRIEIRSSRGAADLFRDGAVWRSAKEDSFPADPDGVGKILSAVADFATSEIASRNPEKHSLFDLDSASAVEVLLSTGGKPAARFYIGKSGSDFSSTYVRDAAGTDVFLEPGSLRSVFDRGTRTWRDKAVFRLDEAKMVSIELDRNGEILFFENRPEGGWTLTKPEGYRSKGPLAAAVGKGLTKLTAADIVPPSDLPLTGLDHPVATVRIAVQGEADRILLVGAEKAEGGGRYVKRASDDFLYLVPSARIANYIRPAEELIEPVPPDSSLIPPPQAGAAEKGPSGGE